MKNTPFEEQKLKNMYKNISEYFKFAMEKTAKATIQYGKEVIPDIAIYQGRDKAIEYIESLIIITLQQSRQDERELLRKEVDKVVDEFAELMLYFHLNEKGEKIIKTGDNILKFLSLLSDKEI